MTKTLSLFAAACTLSAGCASYEYDQDFFDYDRDLSRTRAVLDAQIAKGAAEDAAVRGHHFDELPAAEAFAPTTRPSEARVTLNSLGRTKLDQIVTASGSRVIRVNIDLPEATAAHEAAVAEYLRTAGVAADRFAINFGTSDMAGDAAGTLAKQGGQTTHVAETPAGGLFD